MCIIAWNWQPASDNPLFLISNRDEFYARPSLPVHWWYKEEIVAGKDLLGGGTWLGMNKSGKFAALTNFRSTKNIHYSQLSRGNIVKDFLTNNLSNEIFLNKIIYYSDLYNPFNLLIYDGKNFHGYESHHKKIINIKPGIGVVSNANFYCSWPKSLLLLNLFKNKINSKFNDNFHNLLENKETFTDEYLPNTGLTIEMERILAPIFIKSSVYGTRASSIIDIKKSSAFFLEKTFTANDFSYFQSFNLKF